MITLTLCPLKDAKLMILDGYRPIMYNGTHLLMKKYGVDVLVNGVSERVWLKKQRNILKQYRFVIYDGKKSGN